MRLNLKKVHIPGIEIYVSDALLRQLKRDSIRALNVLQESSFVSDAEMQQDDVCRKIQQYCEEGRPER